MIYNSEGKRVFDLADALQSLKIDATWQIRGDSLDYGNIFWDESNTVELPAESVLRAEIDRLQVEYDIKEYQRNREPEYPDLKELADAVYWQQKGDSSKMDAYVAKVQAVKDKYPKP